MLQDNTLFSKENMKAAASHLSSAIFTLIYDGNDTSYQIESGRELRQAQWILVAIMDHIFDYYPASYFMNEDAQKEYPDFLEWFMDHPNQGIANAIRYVSNNFDALDTVTRDELNQHRVPRRDYAKERLVVSVLHAVEDNLCDIMNALASPKKVTDAERPSASAIKGLINTITKIQGIYTDNAEKRGDTEFTIQTRQHVEILETFKHPLRAAWEVYHYGHHSDFWNEGDSMFEYMMFSAQAKNITTDLIKLLQDHSPFAHIERDSAITKGLISVYTHLLKQDLSQL